MLLTKKFILALYCLFAISAWADTGQPAGKEQCQDLIRRGKEAMSNQQYPLGLELLTKAEILAKQKDWNEELFLVKINIGNIYNVLNSYGDALNYYRQALNIANELKSDEDVAKVLTNIGWMYSNEKDYQNSIAYYSRAYKYKGATRPRIAVNISDVYIKLGNFREAKRYLEEVRDIATTHETAQMWQINYAESLFLEGRTDDALEILEKLSNKVENGCSYCVAQLLSKIHHKLGKTDLAIYYAKQGIRNEHNLLNRSELYNQLFTIYLQRKDYETAIQYKDSVLLARDSIAARINRNLYETIKVKLKIQEYQNEVEISKGKQEAERNFFIIVLLFGLVLSFSISRGLKNKIFKQKQEKIILERNQQITNLELHKQRRERQLIEKQLENTKSKALLKQEQLKNKIAENNRKLSSKVLFISGRNKLIDEVINLLGKNPGVSKDRELSSYIRQLRDYLETDNEWDEFVEHFEKVNPGLLKTLKKKHPSLTAKDIRFLCYIYMNLDTKELCAVFNITPDACRKRSKRLQEKMFLSDEESLHGYLLKIS